MRSSALVSVLALFVGVACTDAPAVTDGGPPPVDAAPRADAGPCGRPCAGGQLCCPAALGFACLPPDEAGGCPLPDLAISAERAASSARVVWQFFPEDDCAIAEGCVSSSGWRRLLRFETFTPNVGTGDLTLGIPREGSPNFTYSDCHRHFHFDGYADYRLRDGSGAEVGTGHKQAFCLLDSERVLDETGVRERPRYSCLDQGISRGWGDSYYAGLDCQWVDVTDVAPGEYTLHISINGERLVPELAYDNNVADVTVTIPPAESQDPTLACATVLDGPRDCGWTLSGTHDCTPDAELEIGCGSGCSLGTCEGDPMLRVCPGEGPCDSHEALTEADDGCGGLGTASMCPLSSFRCPASGRYTVLVAPYLSSDPSASCAPAVR